MIDADCTCHGYTDERARRVCRNCYDRAVERATCAERVIENMGGVSTDKGWLYLSGATRIALSNEPMRAALADLIRCIEAFRVYWPGDHPLGADRSPDCWCSEVEHDPECAELIEAMARARRALEEKP